jgi:hypothetical protein
MHAGSPYLWAMAILITTNACNLSNAPDGQRPNPDRSPAAPGEAESSTADASAPADPASDPGQHDQAGPVHCRLELPDAAVSRGNDFELAVLIAIDPPYEIYDLGARSPAVATSLTLKLPPGFHASQSWSVPKTVPSASPTAHPVYAGQVRFTRGIRIDPTCEPGGYQLGCSVTYQACTARQCLRPAQCALSAEVEVVH